MAPRQLCNSLLHKFLFRPRLGESPHVFQIARTEALDAGELRAEIPGKPVNDLGAPTFRPLPFQNVSPNRPVQQDEFAVDGEGGSHLGSPNALFDLLEERRIAGRWLKLFRHRLLQGMSTEVGGAKVEVVPGATQERIWADPPRLSPRPRLTQKMARNPCVIFVSNSVDFAGFSGYSDF